MTSGVGVALLFLSGLFAIFSISFLWLWLDYREKRRAGWVRMRSRHFHHILLGIWPWLLAGLVVRLNGDGSDQLVWISTLLTGIFLYCAGLWDLRFERVGIEPEKVEVASALLTRLAFRYPFGEVSLGICGVTLGVPLSFFGSSSSLSFARLIIACGVAVGLGFITIRLVGMWDRQMVQQRQHSQP